MAAPARIIENKQFTQIVSEIAAVGDVINLESIDAIKPHVFAGVQFFDSADGSNQATPGAGTVVLTIETVNTSPVLESPQNDTIDATAPVTCDWAANTQRVIATPTGITVATHYRLVVSCNET